jgi:hypothetical protein
MNELYDKWIIAPKRSESSDIADERLENLYPN